MIKINKIIIIAILVLIKLKMVTSNKYCSLQSVTGQSRYFMCGRHEYCCTFGCCVHLAFQFYQLWYYWLLLIFMFMVCSGGSWWYRFCRQNDSSGSIRSQLPGSDTGSYYGVNHHLLHSTPTRSSSNLNGTRHPTSAANDYDRRVTLVRNNGVHSYYYRNGRNAGHYDTASVRYHNGAAANDRTLRRYQQQPSAYPHQNNFLPRLELCPYYQLYGPPPSYESVVQLSSDNSTTSCALADPLTTIAPTTTDESCVGAALVTPTPSISTSPRIIQPIVTVNLSNALSTSIEVRPICSSSGNLPLSNDSQTASTMNTNTNHIEVIQQQQLQHQVDSTTNEIINDNKIIDTPNNLKILNSIKTTIEPTNIQEELIRSDNKSDQKHIPESCDISNCGTITASSTTTTTTTIVPLSFRTNFLMRNEKNSIPSVCSSNSTLTTVPNKYCSSEQQQQKQQQQSMLLHQHQHQQQQLQPTTSIILKDFDNTQCTCSIGSSTIMSTISTSQAHTNNSKSIIELNKSKFLKSSKFNRKYYKKNSNSSSGSSNNDNSNNHQSNSNNLINNGSNCNNLNARNGINYNRQASSGELLNPILPSSPLNILSSLDRSVLDNLVSNPNDMMQTISSTTTASTETISTNLPVKVAIAKINSKKH